jgi:ATP-dependent protease ClpP protease subunit
VSSSTIREQLTAAKGASTIRVKLNSGGGSAFDGLAIRNLLREHPARIEVDVEGLAASAASVVAMAGDRIRMHDGAMMMIHNASSSLSGTSKELERSAQTLKSLDDSVANIYSQRSRKKTAAQMLELMEAETWLDGYSAVALGLADEVVSGSKAPQQRMAVQLSAYGYRNVPDALRGTPQTRAVADWQLSRKLREQGGVPRLRAMDAARELGDGSYNAIATLFSQDGKCSLTQADGSLWLSVEELDAVYSHARKHALSELRRQQLDEGFARIKSMFARAGGGAQ